MSNWIPVTEKLPEILQSVLVVTEYNNYYVATLFNGADKDSSCWMSGMLHLTNITHWMPLPEPPKTNEI